jgi:DNA-binding GntR family transcriptional regulator
MTEQQRALKLAADRMIDLELAWDEADVAQEAAYDAWKEADKLYARIEAGDPDAIRQILEEQR